MADFSEIHGWPRERHDLINLNGTVNERKVRCAWSDRVAVANELFSTAYPYGTSLAYPYNIKIDPERNSKHSDAGSGKISYETAILTVLYSTFLEIVSGNVISEQLIASTSAHQVSPEKLFWDISGAEPLDTGYQKISPTTDYILHYYRLGGVPEYTYLLPGFINSNTVFSKLLTTLGGAPIGWTPGFLMYKHATINRTVTTGGTKLYDVINYLSYAFNPDVNGDGLGWNGVWRQEKGAYAKVYDAAGDQVLPYPSTAFSL